MSKHALDTLPLEWVRAFEAAGRLGSFTAAAGETGLTQAAISQRIGHLERRLGARLFDRNPRGVSLTVEGEAWLPYVSGALSVLRDSSQDLFSTRGSKITIAASASVAQLWLAPRLSALPANMDVTFTTMVVRSDFQSTEAAVEIRYGTGGWPERYSQRLYTEILSPVGAEQRADWKELPRIGVSGPRAGWQEWARQMGEHYTPIPRLRFDSFCTALAAAQNGAGVMLASVPLVGRALASGSVSRLSEHELRPDATYWMSADKSVVTKRQWNGLTKAFCQEQPASV